MTIPGKNAPGLKGFPTPDEAADISSYLLLYFPDQTWAQYALGALKTLTFAYNWYKSGNLDTEEAAAIFQEIVEIAPYNTRTCSNPDGGKIIRVAPNGHVQQLGDGNVWEEPTGDYQIPPVPEREEADPECLAAKNAANVLQLLYENVTDSFNADLDEAEAATALTLTLVGLLGAEFAPITFALITFFGVVFSVLYGLLEFVGADLWDENFTEVLYCILLSCASNDAGVITFDWVCFNDKLAGQVTITTLTFEQLRLFGQLQYLLLVIGGVDALNQAGATTAITDGDCSACAETWCYLFDDTHMLSTWNAETFAGGEATYDGCWQGYPGSTNAIWISKTFSPSINVRTGLLVDWLPNTLNGAIFANGDGSAFSGTNVWANGGGTGDWPETTDRIDIYLVQAFDSTPRELCSFQFEGLGANPIDVDNC